jgi:hypothetical protein
MVKCDKTMTFEECELAILRVAIDKSDHKRAYKLKNTPEVKIIFNILEEFLRQKKGICYGGTAINNILPEKDQFYDRDIEIPDYDFFSSSAMKDAKQLADIYYKNGFTEVEAKAGVHFGTYKVFVNYIPIADITQLESQIYNNLKRSAISRAGILYAPPNFLRMLAYLELSRPDGDTSRWEKVLKRLTLLNKNYPIKSIKCLNTRLISRFKTINQLNRHIFDGIRDILVQNNVVFFGGFANLLYSKYLPKSERGELETIPDFDVLYKNPRDLALKIEKQLKKQDIKNISIVTKDGIGEVISPHYEVRIDNKTVVILFEPLACHSYNKIRLKNKIFRVATIDTMLSFFLAFIYINRPHYNVDRILCMANYLLKIQQRNRLRQKGLLRRFSISCYGVQETIISMRIERTKKFKELRHNRNSEEYHKWFLRYVPFEEKLIDTEGNKKTKKAKTKKAKTKKAKTKKSKTRKLKKTRKSKNKK